MTRETEMSWRWTRKTGENDEDDAKLAIDVAVWNQDYQISNTTLIRVVNRS